MAKRKIFWEVDVQADFMLPGGKLYVPGAEKLIPNIKRLVSAAAESGSLLVSSGDAHPEGDPEFRKFPPHCLAGSPGARILPEGLARSFCTITNNPSQPLPDEALNFPQVIFEKQTLDVFDNPRAGMLVERSPADAEYIVFGVVTEFCVERAAKGLLARHRHVAVVKDAIAALDANAGSAALEELQSLGARLITTAEALASVAVAHRAPLR